jgi:hypothetical integral membrane protein (TIGR02206 family)
MAPRSTSGREAPAWPLVFMSTPVLGSIPELEARRGALSSRRAGSRWLHSSDVVDAATASEFAIFGLARDVTLGVFVVVAAALVIAGRRCRGTLAQRRLSRILAVVFATILILNEVYWLWPGHSQVLYSLPLQLCDVAAMASVWALWSQSKTPFALTYFWGLTLTSQALLTPVLHRGFASLAFWTFFGLHSLVVWAAIYLTWGVGLRPDWRSYRVAVLATMCWGVMMFIFNRLAATNYGFLDAKPQVKSILDLLGTWPWYLLSEVLLGAAVWALLTWPWVRTAPPGGLGQLRGEAG